MLTEFFFLQGHKFIDWTLFTASHGWKWRPYYQFPRVWNYSYGNQGLHIENIYDPFENTAYEAGPLYNAMESLVDAVGQGPNPQWVRDRIRLNRALAKSSRELHMRFSPQNTARSFKREQYYLKQFSLNLHVQWIYKYWTVLLRDFLQYKILPPLIAHAPKVFRKIEDTVRRIDYHYANKSVGYHLFSDILEQLNPPLDYEDKIIPYDYIAESGSRMLKQYKDYCYLSEMKQDLSQQVSKYGKLYDDFQRLAKEEKYNKMGQGDPFASRFHIPSVEEYCMKFHNFDLKTRAHTLMDLHRVTSDYKAHFGPFDLAMATLHKFLFEHTTPDIYGQYWRKKQTLTTSNEVLNSKEANYFIQTGDTTNSASNINPSQGNDFLTTQTSKYNPLNSLYRDSRQPHELTMKQKLDQLKHEFELAQNEKIFDLDRTNVKYIRALYNERDAPLHHVDQLPHELSSLHADIMAEMMTVLPVSIHDNTLLKPLFEDYYNNRVNQHIYKKYPSILEADVKQDLDLKYDRSATEQYFDYIHERVDKRKALKEERAAILAPYEAIRIAKQNIGQYAVNKQEYDFTELQLQDDPYDHAFSVYPGNPKLDTDDPSVRYRHLQQYGYQKMLKDIQEVEKVERAKALKMTHGWSSIQRRDQLFNDTRENWGPTRRMALGLPPMTSTKFQNVGGVTGGREQLDFRPENFSKEDITLYSKVYPGVSFDQVLRVLDDAETARPAHRHPSTTKESIYHANKQLSQSYNNPDKTSPFQKSIHKPPVMDWEGLPRRFYGNDPKRDWATLRHRDELERFREDNKALMELYKNHFHTSNDNPREMKHKYLLSGDLNELKTHTQ